MIRAMREMTRATTAIVASDIFSAVTYVKPAYRESHLGIKEERKAAHEIFCT
jgi:hypothetical protein